MIDITDIEEYEYARKRGYEPLLDVRFNLDIHLRVRIQIRAFGEGADHEKFYRWVWEHKRHVCEETMKPLGEYSAAFVSHILTKGGFPEMMHDPRNTNILCLEAHNRWEFGDREGMRIFEQNQLIINQLKQDYRQL